MVTGIFGLKVEIYITNGKVAKLDLAINLIKCLKEIINFIYKVIDKKVT